MMRLAGIIWDYDGTIADTYEKNRRVTIELLKNFDKDIADHLPEVLQTTEAFKASQQRYFSWRSQYRDEFGLTDKQIAKAEKLWAFYQMSDTEIPKSLQNCGWLNTFYCSFRMKLTLKDPDGKLQYGTKTDFAFSAFLAKTYKEITSGETVTGGMKPMSVDNSYYKFAAETPGYLKVTLSYTIGSLSLPADNDIILSLADAGKVEPAMNRQTLTINSGKTATAYYALNKGSCYAEVRSSIPLFTLKTEFKADTVAGGSVKSTAAAVTPGKTNRVSLGMKGYEDASLWYKFSLKEDASVSSVIKTIHGNSDYEVRYYNSKGHRIKSLTDKGRKLDEGTYYVRITKTSEDCNAVITMKIGK